MDAQTQQPPQSEAPRRRAERGSAMIIALLIMIILTLLGVTFLVMSESEEQISVNERDHAQALYLAEAGVAVALTWFQDPDPSSNVLKPSASQFNRNLRRGAIFNPGTYTNTMERDPLQAANSVDVRAPGNKYTGGNVTGAGVLFDKQYRGAYAFGLWGRRETPDVLICSGQLDVDGDTVTDCVNDTDSDGDTVDDSNGFILDLNETLRVDPIKADGHVPRDFGVFEIEQVRVYRPPIDFDLGTRYGLATVEVSAVKRARGRIVTRRTVRDILQEIPFPGPSGAIETESEIGEGGSAGVHWGPVISSSTADNITLPGANANFPDAAIPRSTSARWGYHFTINPAAFTNLHGPNQTAGQNGTGCLPAAPLLPCPVATALTELVGTTRNGTKVTAGIVAPKVGDPWLIFRARGQIIIGNGSPVVPPDPQPFPYSGEAAGGANGRLLESNANKSITGNNAASYRLDHGYKKNWSHLFQQQVVRFPAIDYQTWKDIAQSGLDNMHYFENDTGDSYKENGNGASKDWLDWIDQNADVPAEPGVFFFDTADSSVPLDDLSNLTSEHDWDPGVFTQGFIYLNTELFKSSGSAGGGDVRAKMPGEVFLDDGIDLHEADETAGNDCICIRFDEEDGCVLGIRPIGYNLGGDCQVAVDIRGDDCRCGQTTLDAMNATEDALEVARAEADTFRNGIWDVDFNNDGVSDGLETMDASLSGYPTFVTDNPGGVNGMGNDGKGWLPNAIPYYPATARSFSQGKNTGVAGVEDWKRDPRFMNFVAALGGSAVNRQPHEPFLNFQYPTTGTYGQTTPTAGEIKDWSGAEIDDGVRVNFRAQGAYNDMSSATTATGWTKKTRDATGAVMNLEVHVDGIMYNEGAYGGTGNLKVYGSLMMRGGYSGTGSVDVWFNEDVVKGKFPPDEWELPRVMSSARETN